jgi:hypothetical protein
MTFIRFFNSINLAPRCIDCKHYLITKLITGPVIRENAYATAKCKIAIHRCSDTGEYKYEYAYIVRSDEKMCGSKGANFLPLVRREN